MSAPPSQEPQGQDGGGQDARAPGPSAVQAENRAYILYALDGLENYRTEDLQHFALDITLSFAATDGLQETTPIPGWHKRRIEPQIFDGGLEAGQGRRAIPLTEAARPTLVFAVSPQEELWPDAAWRWEEVDERIRAAATDSADPFTFGHLFTQMLHVALRLTYRGVPVSAAQTMIDVCDSRRLGSLYQRIVDRLIKPDTERQSRAAGVGAVDHAFHPWFPVLLIGMDKASLYTDALVEDIVYKKRHLTDPRWLMRVGLYLEFLTCLGIFEAVKDEMGDVLTPEERRTYETSPLFAEIRKRVNPRGWRRVWELRQIALARYGVAQVGPVSSLNLLKKKRAVLAFLRVHHDDLKNAIELAGKNEHYAQETWHRVFRDAERAVLRKTPAAFPELAYLDPAVRNFVLWHKKGGLGPGGPRLVPQQVSGIFGDQDGLYVAACTQYRASMNEVAAWAKERALMDYTGKECVPPQASLLQAYVDEHAQQIERLQRRDGYTASLGVIARLPVEEPHSVEQVSGLLDQAALFQLLTESERRCLADTARRIVLGPLERLIVEGREGSSLFIVGEGTLEVLARQADGFDTRIEVIKGGKIFGEISLLTGGRRTATVRALETAVVYEIGKTQFEPIIRARPDIVEGLAVIMERHLRNIREHREDYEVDRETATISRRIKRLFFGVGRPAAT
jgi:CRP-like cAMP-binding protein